MSSLETPITVEGTVLGTPAYMPPEQLAGDPVDARGDQFAFAVVAWECLYGRRPFEGATLGALEVGAYIGGGGGHQSRYLHPRRTAEATSRSSLVIDSGSSPPDGCSRPARNRPGRDPGDLGHARRSGCRES